MKHGSEKSSEDRFESCIGCSRCLQLFHEFLLLLLRLHPCSIRVSSVAKKILNSHLGSIFAARFGILSSILLWLISLRLAAIGFDLHAFLAVIAGGAMDCQRPSTGQQEDEPREAGTTARVIRITINRF